MHYKLGDKVLFALGDNKWTPGIVINRRVCERADSCSRRGVCTTNSCQLEIREDVTGTIKPYNCYTLVVYTHNKSTSRIKKASDQLVFKW